MIPFATPNSGKSFCWRAIEEYLKQEGWTTQSVSSDAIRGAMLKEYMDANKCDRDTAFNKTMKAGPAEYSR